MARIAVMDSHPDCAKSIANKAVQARAREPGKRLRNHTAQFISLA